MAHCSEQLISDYLDGDLSEAAAPRVEAHLTRCSTCRAQLRDFRLIVRLARTLLVPRCCGGSAPDLWPDIAVKLRQRPSLASPAGGLEPPCSP